MQKDLGQSDHPFLRKVQKCVFYTQIGHFEHLFDVFSGTRGRIDLIPFAYCQATSGTSLEYPHGVFWRDLKIAIFCPEGHLLGEF